MCASLLADDVVRRISDALRAIAVLPSPMNTATADRDSRPWNRSPQHRLIRRRRIDAEQLIFALEVHQGYRMSGNP
jgi:hypothetical protein